MYPKMMPDGGMPQPGEKQHGKLKEVVHFFMVCFIGSFLFPLEEGKDKRERTLAGETKKIGIFGFT